MIALLCILAAEDPAPTVRFVVPAPKAAPAIDADRMLAAIAQVENWKRGTVGSAGEYGPYQIIPSVWRRYSRQSAWSASPAEHHRVASRHLEDVRKLLAAAGHAVTPFSIGLAWNAGPTAAIRGTAPARSRDYAARARNVYEASK